MLPRPIVRSAPCLASPKDHLAGLGGLMIQMVHDELMHEAAMAAAMLTIFQAASTKDLAKARAGPNWAAPN